MAANQRVFTLRLSDEVFDKIGILANTEHRFLTDYIEYYIEYVLLKHLNEIEQENVPIQLRPATV